MINCTFENGNKNSLRHAVVDNLVLKDGKILLVKRTGKILEGNKWGLVAGFVERDETLEEAAKREIMEETGWEVKDIKLLKINDSPNRPKEDRQNIAFVYTCEAIKKSGDADWESEEQRWFDLSALPDKGEFAFDHFEDIEFYLKNNQSFSANKK